MVNRNLLRQYDLSETELQRGPAAVFQRPQAGDDSWLPPEEQELEISRIVSGRVLQVQGDEVWVDVGYQSEGVIPLQEWYDEGLDRIVPPRPGDEIQVLLDAVEDESGAIVLSYRKAKRQKEWEDVLARHKEGDFVKGTVARKIKGGLLVNIGVNVFLPASQIDIRRPHDIGDFVGKEIECKILKIDEARRNIVVSRRKLIDDQREEMKAKLLAEIEPGQIRKGIVKNIADLGAFVDLGGIDGLLHITDMSWGRVASPREMVEIDQEIEVYTLRAAGKKGDRTPKARVLSPFFPGALNVDREKEKIALSLKHRTPSPWEGVEERYPIGSQHTGEVVNVMSYGAFATLEPGIEGLLHISELADHKVESPEEVVKVGDEVEVKLLCVDTADRRIGLSHKRLSWQEDAEKGSAPAPRRELRGGTGSSGGQLFRIPEAAPDRRK